MMYYVDGTTQILNVDLSNFARLKSLTFCRKRRMSIKTLMYKMGPNGL